MSSTTNDKINMIWRMRGCKLMQINDCSWNQITSELYMDQFWLSGWFGLVRLKELSKSHQTESTKLTKNTTHNEPNLFSHRTKPTEFERFCRFFGLAGNLFRPTRGGGCGGEKPGYLTKTKFISSSN